MNFAYSNFGYCILGRVIEKITGEPYSAAVQRLVLEPCGIQDMRIGGDTYGRTSGERGNLLCDPQSRTVITK